MNRKKDHVGKTGDETVTTDTAAITSQLFVDELRTKYPTKTWSIQDSGLVVFEDNGFEIHDPHISVCGRFEVIPMTYGMAVADADSLQRYNRFRVLANPQCLARLFSLVVRRSLSAAEIEMVVELNSVENDALICHTHDVCDANMLMLEAFVDAGLLADHRDAPADYFHPLWCAAWDLAKTNSFALGSLPEFDVDQKRALLMVIGRVFDDDADIEGVFDSEWLANKITSHVR